MCVQLPANPGERFIPKETSTFIGGSPGTIQRLIVVAGITADIIMKKQKTYLPQLCKYIKKKKTEISTVSSLFGSDVTSFASGNYLPFFSSPRHLSSSVKLDDG